jgi:hypothetical protein
LIPVALYSAEKAVSIKSWNFECLATFNFLQISLTNWEAGGQSSTSGVALFNVFGNYNKDNLSWENSLDMGYGLLKEQNSEMVKSNDKFDFNSKFGLKKSEKLYYSTLFEFNTQFAPGYKYPNTTDAISRFRAPAYMILSLGMDYKPSKKLSVFVSPLTGKMTIVSDQVLSDMGSFGVDPGKKVRTEVGSFAKVELNIDIMENVSLNSKIDLFSNYFHNPENIDVKWNLMINMKINDNLSANFISNMVYDDDIKIAIDKNNDGILESDGPRVQFKEMFGLGLSLKF